MFLGITIATTAEIIAPLYYKRLFDGLASAPAVIDQKVVVALVGTLVMILLFHVSGWVCWRMVVFINSWFQTRVMADLEQSALSYLLGHSYLFFSNSFAGSLVRKVARLSRAFEGFADEITFKLFPLVLIATGNLIVLFLRDVRIGAVLLGWVILFLIINIIYARWKQRYDVERAAQDSIHTGTLSDIVTNAVTVKLFSGFQFENGLFKEVSEKLRRLRKFTWNLGEVMDAIQARS